MFKFQTIYLFESFDSICVHRYSLSLIYFRKTIQLVSLLKRCLFSMRSNNIDVLFMATNENLSPRLQTNPMETCNKILSLGKG